MIAKWGFRILGIIICISIGIGLAFLSLATIIPNAQQSTLTTGIALVSVIFAAISTGISYMQVLELQRQKNESERPNVIVYIEAKGNSLVYVIIENLGLTPAKNVKVKFDPSPLYKEEKPLNEVSMFANPISILPPQKRLEQLIGVGLACPR